MFVAPVGAIPGGAVLGGGMAGSPMGGGAVLVDVDDASGALKEVFTYDEHESIVYGADWVQLDGDDDSSDVLVTCSFYDKSVRCWHV